MKLPLESSTPQPVSVPHGPRPSAREPKAVSIASWTSVTPKSPLKTAQAPRDLPASFSPLPAKQGSVANADVALRVSVIDGADRMVYSDVRDRKGWAQPLAVNEALRDAGYRSGARDVPLGLLQPRVVRELELRPSIPRNELASTASPYQVGKANIRSPALNASSRVETKMPKELVAARQPSPVSRSR